MMSVVILVVGVYHLDIESPKNYSFFEKKSLFVVLFVKVEVSISLKMNWAKQLF